MEKTSTRAVDHEEFDKDVSTAEDWLKSKREPLLANSNLSGERSELENRHQEIEVRIPDFEKVLSPAFEAVKPCYEVTNLLLFFMFVCLFLICT